MRRYLCSLCFALAGCGGSSSDGPSDTGNPKGEPFPPGTYELSLSANGTQNAVPFTVSAQLPIELVP